MFYCLLLLWLTVFSAQQAIFPTSLVELAFRSWGPWVLKPIRDHKEKDNWLALALQAIFPLLLYHALARKATIEKEIRYGPLLCQRAL